MKILYVAIFLTILCSICIKFGQVYEQRRQLQMQIDQKAKIDALYNAYQTEKVKKQKVIYQKVNEHETSKINADCFDMDDVRLLNQAIDNPRAVPESPKTRSR